MPTETTHKGEATIHYTLSHEYGSVTVPVTLKEDGEDIVFEAHDDAESDPVRFRIGENTEGTVKLWTVTGQNVNGDDMTRLAFMRDDGRSISLGWEHDEKFVDEVELDTDLYDVISERIEAARGAQGHLTVAEAEAETGIDIPEMPLVVEETRVRTAGWSGMTYQNRLTVVPADDADVDTWNEWSEAYCEAGDYHNTHITTKHHVRPPEDGNYEEGDTLTLHELIDGWHSVNALDVVLNSRHAREERERQAEKEREHEALEASYELDIERTYEEGRGEGHAIKANVTLTDIDTGESGSFTLRNAVDIGWQAFANDESAERMLEEGNAREYLHRFGPIPTGFRMTANEGGF